MTAPHKPVVCKVRDSTKSICAVAATPHRCDRLLCRSSASGEQPAITALARAAPARLAPRMRYLYTLDVHETRDLACNVLTYYWDIDETTKRKIKAYAVMNGTEIGKALKRLVEIALANDQTK